MGIPFDIICFSHQWDKFRRRYRSIMMELAKRKEVGTILFVEMPLTLTSFINFKLGRTGQYTAERWQRMFSRGMIFQEGKYALNWTRLSCHRSVTFIMRQFAGLTSGVKSLMIAPGGEGGARP